MGTANAERLKHVATAPTTHEVRQHRRVPDAGGRDYGAEQQNPDPVTRVTASFKADGSHARRLRSVRLGPSSLFSPPTRAEYARVPAAHAISRCRRHAQCVGASACVKESAYALLVAID